MSNITIIGMGLIGTSLGLALKKSGMKDLRLVGHDKEPKNSRTAAKMGAIDDAEMNLPRSVEKADMVILATPVVAIREVMEQIAPILPKDCIVTDTGSTKGVVMDWAAELLPPHVHFIGGHPMAGKETSGPEAAVATLFEKASYVLIPSPRASVQAAKTVTTMAEAVGAKPFYVNPQEHDAFVAAVSHLPIVLASTLVLVAAKSPAWHEMSKLAAGGFRDTTRVASGDSIMSRDICLTNSAEVLHWIDRFITELMEFRRVLMAGDEKAVGRHFDWTAEQRDRWLQDKIVPPHQMQTPEIPGVAEQLSSLFVGDHLARKGKEMMKQMDPEGERERKPR